MRKEPYAVGSYVHIIKRGAHGMAIVRDEDDRVRFLLMLRHLNDTFYSLNWFRDVSLLKSRSADTFLVRPPNWPPQEKIVKIICFCLVENHFHLLLEEIVDGGISLFMKRLGVAMAKHFNEKYKESGSLFQGAYRSRTINNDSYLRYVSAYIQIKNCFELFPGGYSKAVSLFDEAFLWSINYPYCSLGAYYSQNKKADNFIVDTDLLSSIFTKDAYKNFSKDVIIGRSRESLVDVSFE